MAYIHSSKPGPTATLAYLIDVHGTATVLKSLVRVLTRLSRQRRHARLTAAYLSPHLHRDIGLGDRATRIRGSGN